MASQNETEDRDTAQRDENGNGPQGDGKNKDDDNSKQPSGQQDASDQKKEPKKPPFYKRPVPMIVLGIILIVGGIFLLLYWLHARKYESTDDAFIDGHIVSVSPKVSGIVSRVYINDNSQVKAGDKLVELDDRDYRAALDQAQGEYDAAVEKVTEAKQQIGVAQAEVAEAMAEQQVAEANAQNAQDDLNRFLALDVRARSKQQMDNATASQRTTAAQVEDAKAKVVAAQAQLDDARIGVKTAEANVETALGELQAAKNNIGYCTIYAESDGVITRKNVEPGMYIQVDQPMFSIVKYDVWVIANYKETQLDRIYPGQPVSMEVDAYPGRKITGKVQSIQNGTGSRFTLLPPENATGNYVKIVQRVPVKIVLDPHQNEDMDHLLSPGMSVDPEIKVR